MSRPLTKVLIFYTLGLVLGYSGFLPLSVLAVIALALLTGGILSVFHRRENRVLYLYLLAFVLGAINLQWHAGVGKGNVDSIAGFPAIITGTICEEPDVRPDYTNYVIKIEKAEVHAGSGDTFPDNPSGRLLLTITGKGPEYAFGDRLQLNVTPVLPKESGQPGEFNYRQYLASQGIQLTARTWQGTGVHKIGTGKVNFFIDACISIKGRLLSVTRATMAPRYAGLLQGLLFGSGGMIDDQIRSDFALVGVVHILSVSGYHVTLLVAICLFLINGFKINRHAGIIFTAVVTLSYTVMSGSGPAAVRSLIMGWTMLLARYLKRDYDWASSLSLSALTLLIINPTYFTQAGFQLSFAATWGVLSLTPQICRLGRFITAPAGNDNEAGLTRIPSYFVKRQGLWRLLGQSAGITLGAQLAVFPITSYYFNSFSLLAVPANLIIVPLTSLIMILGGLASVSGLIWLPLAGAVNVSTAFITEMMLSITHWLAGLPLAAIVVRQPAVYEIAAFYIILFSVTEASKNPAITLKIKRICFTNYRFLIPVGLAAIACLLWLSILMPGIHGLELTFLDVGQGDAAVLVTPGGFTAVIDTGGAPEMSKSSFNPGEKILMPFLRSKGISRIDVLLLSHPHSDHIQGAGFLASNIPVRMLIIDRQFCADSQGARLAETFGAKGAKIREVSGGDLIWFDEKTKLEVLSPLEQEQAAADVNDDSLVFRLGFGEFHALFTGDAGAEVLGNLEPDKVHAEIVKVPHHGSKNSWSEAFYRNAKPEAAVVSVGTNYFGHPSGQVMRGLQKLGAACYRTDRCGAVIIATDGNNYQIRTGKTLK